MTEPTPKISIVISTFNRPKQLEATLQSIFRQAPVPDLPEIIVVDDGTDSDTPGVCRGVVSKYIRCDRPPSTAFRNPALPMNMGIRAATGEVVILQNAECLHADPQTIQKLASLVTPSSAVFAYVIALNPDGSAAMDYCSPTNPRPYFFCGAIRRDWLVRLRGFDEDFFGAGFEDDDLADRLGASGVEFVFVEQPIVHHQWHPPAGDYSSASEMCDLYQSKLAAMLRGELGLVRNLNRPWGGEP